jgi:hypothetical protein
LSGTDSHKAAPADSVWPVWSKNEGQADNGVQNATSAEAVTIRQDTHELRSGSQGLDAFAARGRKRGEDHLPPLLSNIKALVASQSQTDPQCRTTRLSTRLSAAAVRRQLIAQQGDTDDALKKIPATNAIFAQVTQMHRAADVADDVWHISMDAKAIVTVAPCAHGGKSAYRSIEY